MSIEIINIVEYKTRYPDTALNGIRDQRIQSAINLAFSYLDVKTGCAISSRWNLQDTDPQHLTTEQKGYVKEAFYVETQYILSNNMDFSQGADQTSFGSLSMSSSRPERKEVCESALMYLQKAGLYDYMSFSSPSYAGSGLSAPAGVPQYDSGNEFITQAVGDNRYVAKSQGVANKWLKTDENGVVVLTEMTLDTSLYYNKTQINELLLPLQTTCNKLGLGYLKSIKRNTIAKTITIADDLGNFITFPYGGSGGGGGTGGIADVMVNGSSVVVGDTAYIDLTSYATKLELLALLDDTNVSSTKTWSSDKIQAVFNTLSGVATIEVVDTLPTTLVNNTMYYVKITEGNYAIKLRVNDTTYDMGTTQIDLSNYQTKLDANQLLAVNSGITATKVTTYDAYASEIAQKQDKITTSIKVQDNDDDNHVEMTCDGGLERKVTSGIITETYSAVLPQKNGVIALTSDIPDTSNFVTTNTIQGIASPKTFGSNITVNKANTYNAQYADNKIIYTEAGSPYHLNFPSKQGTLAIVADVPVITVSPTGSATDTVQYITINGVEKKLAGSSGGGTWGSITGTLSDQTDLKNALDEKASQSQLANYLPLAGGTMSGDISINGYGMIKNTATNKTTTISGGTGSGNGGAIILHGSADIGSKGEIWFNSADNEGHSAQMMLKPEGKLTLGGTPIIRSKTQTIETVWSGTLAQYNALTTKDSKTLYNITDDNVVVDNFPIGAIFEAEGSDATPPSYGTWTAMSDRIEDEWKAHTCTWTNSAGILTNLKLWAKVSSTKAYVEIEFQGNVQVNSVSSTSSEIEVANTIKMEGTYVGDLGIGALPVVFADTNNESQTASSYISGGSNKLWFGPNRTGGYTGPILGHKVIPYNDKFTPDRTIKRWKRTA